MKFVNNQIQNRDKAIKVVCAMSGGVDSSVSAALLKKVGFAVIGVFMKLWSEDPRQLWRYQVSPRMEGLDTATKLPENRCCTQESEQRARKTAIQLGIPFYVLDLRDEFKKIVVDRFLADTKRGLTPNPCVVCNEQIKFGLLIKKAMSLGADYIATGHYAQIKKTKDGIYHLLRGKDKNKDQTYFLWRLNQEQLGRIIFPVGGFDKTQVRQLAKKWKLPSAITAESQEVCFAGGDIDKFLEKYCGTKPGNIVDVSGNVLGKHNGLWFYTIGQRKGIKLSGGPFYVVAKDKRKNNLVVNLDKRSLRQKILKLEKVSWTGGAELPMPRAVKARMRYRAKEAPAVLRQSGGGCELEFARPQFAATPGQSAVFYKGR